MLGSTAVAGGSPGIVTRPPPIEVDNSVAAPTDVAPAEVLEANEKTVSQLESLCLHLQRIADMHTTVTLCKQQVRVTQGSIVQGTNTRPASVCIGSMHMTVLSAF